MQGWRKFAVLAALGLMAACDGRADAAAADRSRAATLTTAAVIDSALPMDVLLDRFRRDIPKVEALRSDATSRDELVRRVVAAIADSDAVALERLSMNLGEFAWLYFPTTKVAAPPYEVPPALAWFQVQEKDRRGALRALRELGGHRVTLDGYRCDETPTLEGENRIWTGCTVSVSRDGAPTVTLRLFGAILERDNRFAILTYENDF